MKRLPDAFYYHIEAIHCYGLDASSRTIFVHPSETEQCIDEFVAQTFLKNLAVLQDRSDEPIIIQMCTNGGSWDYGMAMYDAIAASHCHITTISYAWARSMSSIIPQAADYRIIMPDALFMIHYGTDGYEGQANGLMPYAEASKRAEKRMLEVYVSRCRHGERFAGKSDDQIERFLRDKMNRKVDWWLTAQESVEYGFMDEVMEQ